MQCNEVLCNVMQVVSCSVDKEENSWISKTTRLEVPD